MTQQPDLEYHTDGLWVRFWPLTPAGEDAWRVMAEKDGEASVLVIHKDQVLYQLKRAGYIVKKARKQKVNEL